ncbi:MAG: poly-beta-1,6 N-acetyl-D-glucosamine synthase, partial [Alphaproteobacteria bacterium]|nr:poly-beta-1,6 N-acetyl-D-glucosamine synthase [Alphaproteobacteria bacterium]
MTNYFYCLVGAVFLYPLVMAYVWIFGAVLFFIRWERHDRASAGGLPALSRHPSVSIVIPCFNEARNIRETIAHAARQNYPDFEIIAINDGSSDDTLEIITNLQNLYPRLRVINVTSNQGKALGLILAAAVSRSEIIVGIDGDSLLAPDAVAWMIHHFLADPTVGAVTGNPRVRNRSTLLGRIQVGEFSSVVGMIKRTQHAYGSLFTVSGVIAAFRAEALRDVGYWTPGMLTEDVDVTWKLQLAGWKIRFEPKALCWVLMPETVRGLWKQRVRWAQGGFEVMRRYTRQILHWKTRRLWPLYLEFLVGALWSFSVVAAIAGQIVRLVLNGDIHNQSPQLFGFLLSITCLAQFALGLLIDARYEKHGFTRGRFYYYWIVWYPVAY